MKEQIITKRIAIDKSNAQMVTTIAIASFVTIFCLVAAHATWSQNSYQARVTSAKEATHQLLLRNAKAYASLTTSYNKFIAQPNNILGQPSNGTGPTSDDNANVILDALPPSYNFPELASSLANVLTIHNYKVTSITGTDDELDQQSNISSPDPKPVSMPFAFTVSNTDYTGITNLMSLLQQSIRPIRVDTIDVSGGGETMTLTVNAHTYYQPAKNLNVTKKVVK